jgi:hypothetical protein
MIPDGCLDLLPKGFGMVKKFDAHTKEEWVFLGVSVIPDDLSVDGEFFPLAGDMDFQETLFRGGRHGVKDVKPVRMNGVCEQGDTLTGVIVQLPGQQRGRTVRGGRQIDPEPHGEIQSFS